MGLRKRSITVVKTDRKGKYSRIWTADGRTHLFDAAAALSHGYAVGRILPTPAPLEIGA